MPVIGGNNPTATVTVPVPTPAPMKKPKQPQQAAPQPVPNNPGSQQQDVPQGMSPVPMVPQLPEPRAIIMPWAPPPTQSSIKRMRVRYEKSGKLGKRDWQPEDDNAIAPEEGLYDESPSSPSESGPAGSHVQGWQLLGGKVHKKFKVLSVKDKSGKITRRLEIAPKGDKSARSILRVKFKGKGAVYEYYFADPDEAKSYLNKLRRSSHPGKVVWELRDAAPEYKRVYGRVNEDYRGEHTAPDSTSGAPLHDVTANGIYPEDVYSHQGLRYYGTGDDAGDAMMHDKINRLRGKPKKMILIYRAIPHGLRGAKINRGDWVTLSKKYAMDHGRSALNGKYRILTKIANAEDVYTNGDSWHEWGYDPPRGREQNPEQMSRKYAKMESGPSPGPMPQPPIEMWHGSRRWDGNPEVRAPKKGRYEAGPGIYMTTNFQTAQRYAKGGGSMMLFHLDPSLKFAHDVLIPKHEAISFVKSAKGIRNRDKIISDIESNSSRRNSDSVSAEVINNLFVNHEAASGNAGLQLVDFLKGKGVDAIFHPHSSQEHWIALINPKKVLKWFKMASKDVPTDRYNLPMVKKYRNSPERYAMNDDDTDGMLDFSMEAMHPEGTEPLHRPSPKEDITGRKRKQILMQMLEAAKKGHYDPAGMTPRDYIREMESPKDIEPGQGQVWMSDPEDELPEKMSRRIEYPRHMARETQNPNIIDILFSRVQENPTDQIARHALAEELEDIGHPQSVIDNLRSGHSLWIGKSPMGLINAIPFASLDHLKQPGHWPGYPRYAELFHVTARGYARPNKIAPAVRVRPSGKLQTWKTRPGEFRLPVKHGMYQSHEITHNNFHEWLIDDPTSEPT